jgi:pimeloyl-ACP methyl ester carboxylesterase
MGPVTEGTLVLGDGRKLGYAEWGPRDAPAVLYFHGFPSCRHEPLLALPFIEHLDVTARVVALDRPGYGLSSFQSKRGFLDWPRDVAEAADQLGIDRFSVLGVSGGCPYALACGYVLGERVERIGIVVGAAPLEASGMSDTLMARLATANRVVRRVQFAAVSLLLTAMPGRSVNRTVSTMGEADKALMERADVRRWFTALVKEAMVHLGRGGAYEAGLYRKPWGFDPADVPVETLLWYAGDDRWIPPSAGRWLAERLPYGQFTLWPEHGHFTWAVGDEVADVLAALVADPDREAETPAVR